jgi:hypothetical protein
MTDSEPLSLSEVSAVIGTLTDLSVRAHDHGDRLLWMVLHCAAESISDGLEQHLEFAADGD